MKPVRRFYVKNPHMVGMRELEAGDHPVDDQGRELPFVPGDFLVLGVFGNYVIGRELQVKMYKEEP